MQNFRNDFPSGRKARRDFFVCRCEKGDERFVLFFTIQKEDQEPQKNSIETEGGEAMLFYVGKEGADHDQGGEKSGGGA